MTPEQLLGLLSPEISIIDPDQVDELIQPLATEPTPDREVDFTTKHRPGPLGAVVGFALFAAVTAAEILVVALS